MYVLPSVNIAPGTLLNYPSVIVKASSGPRYVVSFRPTLPAARLSLDMTTLTIMRILSREVDPMVYQVSSEDPGGASFAGISGLGEQVRELREVRLLNFTHSPNFLSPVSPQDHRTSLVESRALHARWHQATQRRTSIWPARYGQDAPCTRRRCHAEHQFPQSRVLRYCGQVHWRERSRGPRDVWLRTRSQGLCHLSWTRSTP
jgi:hypothetical protein